MELSLARNVKDDKKGFCKYIVDKRKCVPTAEGDAGPGYTGHVRGRVLNTFFAKSSLPRVSLQESQVPETREKIWSKDDLPLVEEDQVRQYLGKLMGCTQGC